MSSNSNKLAHPYRSVPEGVRHLGQSVGPLAPRKDVLEVLGWLRAKLDLGGASSLDREELSSLLVILSTTKRTITERYRPIEAHMGWFSAGVGSVGVLTLIRQLPNAWVIAPLATLILIVSRVVYSHAKSWLEIADEIEKMAADLRAEAKAREPSLLAGQDLRAFVAPAIRRPMLPGAPPSGPVADATTVDPPGENVLKPAEQRARGKSKRKKAR